MKEFLELTNARDKETEHLTKQDINLKDIVNNDSEEDKVGERAPEEAS